WTLHPAACTLQSKTRPSSRLALSHRCGREERRRRRQIPKLTALSSSLLDYDKLPGSSILILAVAMCLFSYLLCSSAARFVLLAHQLLLICCCSFSSLSLRPAWWWSGYDG